MSEANLKTITSSRPIQCQCYIIPSQKDLGMKEVQQLSPCLCTLYWRMKKAMRKHRETMLQLPNAAAKNTINNQCLMTKVFNTHGTLHPRFLASGMLIYPMNLSSCLP